MFSKVSLVTALIAGVGYASASAQQAAVANAQPQPTQPPSMADAPYLSSMPYDWMSTQGYSSVGCGYGYSRGADNRCQRENWYSFSGCYQTTTIIREQCGPPKTVTKTLSRTHTMTEQPAPTTVRVTKTKTMTETKMELLSTQVLLSTQIHDRITTIEKTKTATALLTDFRTEVVHATTHLTEVATATRDVFSTVTEVYTTVVPTTYTSVWLATETEDRTRVVTKTKSAIVTENRVVTSTRTNFLTKTLDLTVTYFQTLPTTIVEHFLSTKTIDRTNVQTVTAVRTFSTDVTLTRTRTEEQTATVTQERLVDNTQLSDCLNTCKGKWNMLAPAHSQQTTAHAQPTYRSY
ncbi:SubName: Full=Uncharacterized protein {ECO:0000313/EMBL:CCA69933.1} [Serendipita indica DSM 11827]|nr:SubName: Full=Uncharacterized protein {ECO:0000313/EMBL:CCA69933.1} [Serendipita indica DSM 11827]